MTTFTISLIPHPSDTSSFSSKTFTFRSQEHRRVAIGGAAVGGSPSAPHNGVFPGPLPFEVTELFLRDGRCFVRDLDVGLSRYGTMINGRPLRTNMHDDAVQRLHDGDELQLGYFGRNSSGFYAPAFNERNFRTDICCRVRIRQTARSLISAARRVSPSVAATRTSAQKASHTPVAPSDITLKIIHTSASPHSSLTTSVPTSVLSPTSSARHPVRKSTRVLDPVPQISASSLSPPRDSTALPPEPVQTSDAAAPRGTDWAGIAQLLNELHVAAPLSRSPSPVRPPVTSQSILPPLPAPAVLDSPSSTSAVSAPVDVGRHAFCYGDFVGASGAAPEHGHTGASSSRDACVEGSGDKHARILLHSADTALRRVGDALMLARRSARSSGATSAELAVARVGAAWRQARGAVDAIILPSVLSTDRPGSIPSPGSVVDRRSRRMNGGVEHDPATIVADTNSIYTSRPHSPVLASTDSRSLGCLAASSPPMPCVSGPWIWPPFFPLYLYIKQHAQLLFPSLHSCFPALAPIHFH